MRNPFKRYRAIVDGHPEPWTLYPQWAGGTVRDQSRPMLVFTGIFSLLWFGASATFIAMSGWAVSPDDPLTLVVFVFPLFGLLPLAMFVRFYLRYREYGDSELVLETFPGSIGGDFRALLRTGIPLDRTTGANFSARFTANHTSTSGTASSGRTGNRRRVLWQTRQQPVARPYNTKDGARVSLPVAFAVPEKYPATSINANEHYWMVEITSTGLKPEYRASFRVPVFETRSAVERQQRAFEQIGTENTADDADDAPAGTGADAAAGPPAGVMAGADERAEAAGVMAGAVADSVVQTDRGVDPTTAPAADLAEVASRAGEARAEADSRRLIERIFRAQRPFDRVGKNAAGELTLTHVRGDRPVRRVRIALTVLAFYGVFVLRGGPAFLLFVAGLVFLVMSRAARRRAVRCTTTADALRVERYNGKSVEQTEYPWSDIGMVQLSQPAPGTKDITIHKKGSRSHSLGVWVGDENVAKGFAAAIEARRPS